MFIQLYEEKYMRFPEGRGKALTFSYDDGVAADEKLVALFDRYGLKGTFNLNSRLFDCREWHDRMDEAQTVRLLKDSPHEVALHGARHVFLEKVPLPEAIREIVDNRSYLENMFGRIVDGMAYAYDSYNDEVVAFLRQFGVKYARTTEPSYSFDIPRDWLRLKPTCHHRDEKFKALAERFLEEEPEKIKKHREPWLFFVWGHAYEFDDDDNWDVIGDFAARASGRADKIWFATNGEIYRYVKAYENLQFSCDGERAYNPSAIPVWIEIRGKIYKICAGECIKFS